MTDHIPFEIQVEIIKRLTVKSLLQFRSVSKQWRSTIDSREFIAGYSKRQTHAHRLFVRDKEFDIGMHSLVDFITFSHQEFAPNDDVLDELYDLKQVIGSSHGLLCMYGYYQQPAHHVADPESMMAVLWNPSIRKLIGVGVHHVADAPAQVILGFGVCPITLDPTIVKITWTIPWTVEIFKLSAGNWRISSSNLQNKPIKVSWYQIALGKYIYWIAFERIVATDGTKSTKSLIVSFDMTTEEFKAINLPDNLAQKCRTKLSISNIRECLAVTEYSDIPGNQVCSVWMMNHEVQNSFTKLFTINTSDADMRILVFTDSGEPIMEMTNDYNEVASLVVYEPSSQSIYDIGIYGEHGSFFVGPYMETLLLLDELNCSVYSDIIRR